MSVSLISSEVEKSLALFVHQLSQHKRQNPAVPIIIDLDRRIDPKLHRQRAFLPVRSFDLQRDLLSWFDRVGQSRDRKLLRTVEPERLRGCALEKLQGQHAHADEVRTVNS